MVGNADPERSFFGNQVSRYATRLGQNQRQRLVRHFVQLPRYVRYLLDIKRHLFDLVEQHQHALFVFALFQCIYFPDRFRIRRIASDTPNRIGGIEDDSSAAKHFQRLIDLFVQSHGHRVKPDKNRHFFAFFAKRI